MASGTINLKQSATSGAYIDAKIEWNATADTGANTSKVTAKIYVRKDNTDTILTIPTEGTWTYKLSIAGNSISGSVNKAVLLDWVLVATHTVSAVGHNSDGSKSITISGSATAPSISSYAGHTTSGSGTANLDTIARASTITSASDVTLGNSFTVKWTPASKSFYYKLVLNGGIYTQTHDAIHPNQTTEYTFTDRLLIWFASAITDDKGTVDITLYTYSDKACTNQVGSADSTTITVTVPDNSDTKPTVAMSLSPVSDLPDTFAGLYIQGKTKVQAGLAATGKYGATIKSYRMKAEGASYDAEDDYTSDYLSQSGSIAIYGYAKDSRGFTGSTSEEITVIAYSKPKIQAVSGESEVVAARCDANGNLSDSGTYLKIKAKRSYSPVESGGVQLNFCKIRYRYKAESDLVYSSWVTILAGDAINSDEVITEALLGGALAVDKTYQVQVQAIDDIGEAAGTTVVVHTERVYCHRDGRRRSFSFGEYVEEDNTFAIAADVTLKAKGPAALTSDTTIGGYPAEAVRQSDDGRVIMASGLCLQWGRAQIVPTAGTPTTISVAFGVAYREAPFVTACPLTAAPGTQVQGVGVTEISAQGCNIVLTCSNNAETSVVWLAIGICAEQENEEET